MICLSIGYPIKTSLSSAMHNEGYKKLGINDQFKYQRREVKPSELKKMVETTRNSDIRGISVTMPHKQTILKYLDKIDKNAKRIGAVNTIVNNNGRLTGYNTDWIGAIKALQEKTKIKGKKIAIIGAGGAARAIVYGLKKKGSVVKIFNRSLGHAKKLAQELGCEYGDLSSLEQAVNMDIIINATSVGMNEDKSPIDKKFLRKNQIILDAVYTPSETRLIKDAKEKGAQVVFGYEMLLYQGIEQFKLYTGLDAPVEAMREVLVKNLK